MPILNFIGKEKIFDLQIPDKNLRLVYNFGTDSENKIIHGDNLIVMKNLLRDYRNKIKCIYIDPPYNTGNENWIYYDKFERDRWLFMMYPRLQLMRELLSDDGSIWISIDDKEQAHLRMICDEIFGEDNFVVNVIWEKKYSPQNDSKYLSDSHDFILVYARNKKLWRPNLLPRTAEMNARYKNPDDDPRGDWLPSDLSVRTYSESYDYEITSPTGKKFAPPKFRVWQTSRENMQKLIDDNRIWFGVNGNSRPVLKRFLSEVKQGMVAKTIWFRDEVGDNQEAARELKSFGFGKNFATPKPTRLIKKILRLSTDKDSLILDAFAGSGSTAHAVIDLNREDHGTRKFILIESEKYCESITAERVKKISGSFSFLEIGI